MGKERLVSPTRKKVRNLKQYRDLSDEEFEKEFLKLSAERTYDEVDLEEQIDEKLKDFGEDYDLSDMKINDRLVLRNLIIAIITLEELEETFASMRTDISEGNMLMVDRLAGVMSKLRKDISDMQNDLKLTRKIRKEGREESFLAWMDKMKERAAEFYREKSLSIFCPDCRMMLSSVWLIYPEGDNKISLHCKRCDSFVEVELKYLYDTDNVNLDDVALP
jgi:hypothetical protein